MIGSPRLQKGKREKKELAGLVIAYKEGVTSRKLSHNTLTFL